MNPKRTLSRKAPPRVLWCLLATLCFAHVQPLAAAADAVSLGGTWRYRLDREKQGESQRWYSEPLRSEIQLPGSLELNRIGDPVTVATEWTGHIMDRSYFEAPEYAPYREPGNIKLPFWLQPETRFVGHAWYQREITISPEMTGRRVVLHLERPHWKTKVWLDDRYIGQRDSLSAAHTYDLGVNLAAGQHRLTVLVDNTIDPDIGVNSHSITDHTQGNWNGIVGRLELQVTAPVWFDALDVYPDAAKRTVLVRGRVAAASGYALPASIELAGKTRDGAAVQPQRAPVGGDGSFSASYPFPTTAELWGEFSPVVHQLSAAVSGGERRDVPFGFRGIGRQGRQLIINGRPLFLRGTLDCAAFPRTGHPPMELAEWKRIFTTIRDHGLNNVRFHSWCPPEAAFAAADELGLYLQVEVASWPGMGITLGDGRPVDAWLEAETERILRAYGHHPSFVMLCAGNEPMGPKHEQWLRGWLARRRQTDHGRLYSAGAGWPHLPESDYHVTGSPRIQGWGKGLSSRINAEPPETSSDYREFVRARLEAVVSHEIGEWCAYPNFGEMSKYTGYLKPKNFEIFRETLEKAGMLDQAAAFLHASGKLQALCYKEDIESALRTQQMGGFHLLGLSDFPGQGTALVGVLDAFWEEKGYITPAEFRRFSGSTVPLARLGRRVFTSEEALVADVEVAHYGPAPLTAAESAWQLVDNEGRVAAHGGFSVRDIPVGGGTVLGQVRVALAGLPAPAKYRFVVTMDKGRAENDWDVWVYPPAESVSIEPKAGVRVVRELDDAVLAELEAGGRILLSISKDQVALPKRGGKVELGFSSIFWNTAWTSRQAPHTLGILCDPKHPALASFPTEEHSNWQWWYPISQGAAMCLDELPRDLKPLVQVIDDWFTNRKLALVFETTVGKGRLLVSSVDLIGIGLDPVRRQLRASLVSYASSDRFAPTVAMTAEQVRSLIAPKATPNP